MYALSAGSTANQDLHDAIVMENLEITSWADYQATPQAVISARLAVRDVRAAQAAAERAALAAGGRR